ncbi:ABC transporter ATP-binding protein [Microcella alkaliphila]|jgi:iron complex transport system ATP-binding protein|uniref:ABC-transport system n=1 Tax=Microcella alkaliphila TaxID=279828 RepID=A0A0U5BD52_9MICO|nr:ABC transporter ATP-binding protein [Microcella alkaliphila]BAU31150.1 ABC-transport system [Microcella alkaliphila]
MTATAPVSPAAAHAAAAPALRAENLTLGYTKDRPVVHGVDLAVRPGALTVLVGANASGKSTLLRGLARLLPAHTGRVTLGGTPIERIAARQLARTIGVLPQNPIAPEGITAGELVARGRYPHQPIFRGRSSDDDAVVAASLAATDAASLTERRMDELSGGQRQRVWIAMALAQQPRILLLDEPTSALDIAHQVEVLDVLRAEVDRGMTVIVVLHDLTLAARYADELVVLCDGRIVAQGAASEILTEATVRDAFGIDARILTDPDTGRPVVLPRASSLGSSAVVFQERV